MPEAPPRRPWWKRKRTWAAGAVWLVVAYPLSAWPIDYLYDRGVIRRGSWAHGPVTGAYAPLRAVMLSPDGPRRGFRWYLGVSDRLMRLGERHAASD